MKEKHIKTYNEKSHTVGRIFLGIAIILILLVPTIISLVLKESPEWLVILKSMLALIIFIASGFIEVISYAPLLGVSGSYLAFFTGNLVNLKIPCAMNAKENANAEHGTEEGEIVSTVSIASSTITTTLVMALGVILLTPLTPVLTSSTLAPAFETTFCALFGALAYTYFVKDIKLVPLPLFLAVLLQVLFNVGKEVLIPVTAIITILFAFWLFKRENKKNKEVKEK